MSDLTKQTTITWRTTPKKLREIADKMELRFQKLTCGESTVVHRIYGGDLTIEITGDQGAFHDMKHPTNPWN